MTGQEAAQWGKEHPIGSAIAVFADPYVVEESDHGHCRKVCNRHYEASVITTRPFVFMGKSCVKIFGFGDKAVEISRLTAL